MIESKQLDLYPPDPGVYLMKNEDKEVIYVGKAKNLKKRLKQYFSGQDDRPMIPFLIQEIFHIDTLVVPSEKEALLLENTLIKKHQPKFNAFLKDDKTFISLMVNHLHPWPMIRLIRYKGKPKEKGLFFGPYTSAYAARQTYELLTRLFPLRQCSDAELARRKRPCLLYGIKRCIAPCVNLCTKEEYHHFVDGAIEFLKGRDQEVINKLRKDMDKASEDLEFEKAQAILTTIQQIEHVTQGRQVVAKTTGKDSDVYGIYRQGDEVILMQLFIREGKLIGSEHYSFSQALQHNEELLESFLLQYYQKKEQLPQEILLPFSLKSSSLLEEILSDSFDKKVTILLPQKGEKKILVGIAEKNAKTTFTQEKDHQELREKMLLDLADTLKLTRYPKRIECFDTSNIAGSDLVASMVTFVDGEKDKSRMRYFKIQNIHKPDDYAALHQVLSRRLLRAKEEDDLPDLIVIDGGKGQLNIALTVFKELDIANVDVISLSKEAARHDKGLTQEQVHTPESPEPIRLPITSPVLFLLQKIRDEAHEKALSFHLKRRKKRVIQTALDDVPGIGPIKKQRLLKHFGSMKRILEASDEALLQVKGINKKDVSALHKYKIDKKS